MYACRGEHWLIFYYISGKQTWRVCTWCTFNTCMPQGTWRQLPHMAIYLLPVWTTKSYYRTYIVDCIATYRLHFHTDYAATIIGPYTYHNETTLTTHEIYIFDLGHLAGSSIPSKTLLGVHVTSVINFYHKLKKLLLWLTKRKFRYNSLFCSVKIGSVEGYLYLWVQSQQEGLPNTAAGNGS